MRQVVCQDCETMFETTGRNAKRCPECRAVHKREYHKKYHAEHYVRKGYNGWGENNNNWKGGLGRLKNGGGRKIKAERRYCQVCRTDLIDATHYMWVIHHIDRDQYNNSEENLMLLCKRCHQIEHECHKAFEGATTIPQGSRVQEDSKRPAPEPCRHGHLYCGVCMNYHRKTG